jgi:hypothetical protein
MVSLPDLPKHQHHVEVLGLEVGKATLALRFNLFDGDGPGGDIWGGRLVDPDRKRHDRLRLGHLGPEYSLVGWLSHDQGNRMLGGLEDQLHRCVENRGNAALGGSGAL